MKRIVLSIICCVVMFLAPTVIALCIAVLYAAYTDNPFEVIIIGILLDAATYTATSVHNIPLFTVSAMLIYLAQYTIKPLVRQ